MATRDADNGHRTSQQVRDYFFENVCHSAYIILQPGLNRTGLGLREEPQVHGLQVFKHFYPE
jgi:hypothetical protein